MQRVEHAAVSVDDEVVGRIGRGLLVLVGVDQHDSVLQARQLADKIVNLRVFTDAGGRMNRSVLDVGGELLVVSQFTLLGDCRKGRRPSYAGAASGDLAEPLVEAVCAHASAQGVPVATGRFGARMAVDLRNDGPVTLLLDTSGAF